MSTKCGSEYIFFLEIHHMLWKVLLSIVFASLVHQSTTMAEGDVNRKVAVCILCLGKNSLTSWLSHLSESPETQTKVFYFLDTDFWLFGELD